MIKSFDNKYVVYLKGNDINIDFDDKNAAEAFFKRIFNNIEKYNDEELNGYFYINVYSNKNYGKIIEIINTDCDCYITNHVEMKIKLIDDALIFKEYNDMVYNKECYFYKNKYYTKYLDDLDTEFYNIVYGDIIKDVIKKGKKLYIK